MLRSDDQATDTEATGTPGRRGGATRFAKTRWDTVARAGREEGAGAEVALEGLLRDYWFPLYAYVRRRGYSHQDAEDLTQGFLIQLLDRHRLGRADPERGRFRSFLLASLNHYLSNRRAAALARKRGGAIQFTAFEGREAEVCREVGSAPAGATPEEAYDVHWALTVLQNVLGQLKREMDSEGRGEVFEALKVFLTEGTEPAMSMRAAAALGISGSAVRMAVHRLRLRYRLLIRAEIARTLSDPRQVDDELVALFEALRVGWSGSRPSDAEG